MILRMRIVWLLQEPLWGTQCLVHRVSDGELWAADEFTNQSKAEVGGVSDMVKRGDRLTDEQGKPKTTDEIEDRKQGRRSSPVMWVLFGLTHNTRVEDWPAMFVLGSPDA
ncbi:uncharacterized protein BKA55DRAFT_536338 [Fusarium redolens]|uniref:Copper amine oxidase catalytic domain-containing protein n=1 Tax=Fusarium redolens TaxID=48865 RepID=A0A9P9HR83_FUSRE|nr:uncharacterized protein BKA55DRAFT_536338 [Fusarium redolens]KAH7261337.1 hypothetical protein BKA55DRAFT_536338 [Fusarium redolens]